MRMRIEQPVRIWLGPLIIFPKHYVPKRDEIWLAGKRLSRRARK
jgi:hypothetical protein